MSGVRHSGPVTSLESMLGSNAVTLHKLGEHGAQYEGKPTVWALPEHVVARISILRKSSAISIVRQNGNMFYVGGRVFTVNGLDELVDSIIERLGLTPHSVDDAVHDSSGLRIPCIGYRAVSEGKDVGVHIYVYPSVRAVQSAAGPGEWILDEETGIETRADDGHSHIHRLSNSDLRELAPGFWTGESFARLLKGAHRKDSKQTHHNGRMPA